jgi:hypothetical protein
MRGELPAWKPSLFLRLLLCIAAIASVLFAAAVPVKAASSHPAFPPGWTAHDPIVTRSPLMLNAIAPDVIGGLYPAQIRKAYGIDKLAGTGVGKTIAVIDAYGDPNIVTDLTAFDTQFGLPAANLTIAYPGGPPGANPGWAEETALDVEWAHAIAPEASILLVIAPNAGVNLVTNIPYLYEGIDYANNHGANVVSMSWGGPEFSDETSVDSLFFNSSGVVYVASAGDTSAVEYPAASPNVVGVGGTTLFTADGNYLSESAWSGSGGGQSVFENEPVYQTGFQSSGMRQVPDVSFDADPGSGVAIYFNGSWRVVGGTSLSAPCWAGLFTLGGLNSISSVYAQAASPALYAANFHDITTGSNGPAPANFAAVGYDQVTGLGSPKANNLIPGVANKLGFVTQPSSNNTAGLPFITQPVVVVQDSVGNTVTTSTLPVTLSITPGTGTAGAGLSGTVTVNAGNGIANFSNLVIDKAGSGYTLTAASTGMTSVISHTLAIQVGPVSKFSVTGYASPSTAGVQSSLTVTAQDAAGNTVTDYTGTVHFTSSDAQAVLPVNYTFVSGDNGVHIFNANLKTSGIQTITATDTVTGTITGTQSGIVVNHAVASQISVETAANGSGVIVPAQNIASGTALTVYAVTRDQYSNFVANAAATWSLVNRTDGVAEDDLTTSSDNKSAVFTGHLLGTAQIHVTTDGLSSVDSGTMTVKNKSVADFDGDGKTDLSVYDPANGNWFITQSGNSTVISQNFGFTGAKLVPGDYDGDGKTDRAVYDPANGNWFIFQSSTSIIRTQNFGFTGAIPVPGDYDGDGKTDLAIYDPTNGNWFIFQSGNGTVTSQNFGFTGGVPVPGDYDGDGKTDLAVYDPTNGNWFIYQSGTSTVTSNTFGFSGAKLVPGDYDGDGKTDLAVYDPANGNWFILQSGNSTVTSQNFGFPGAVPIP